MLQSNVFTITTYSELTILMLILMQYQQDITNYKKDIKLQEIKKWIDNNKNHYIKSMHLDDWSINIYVYDHREPDERITNTIGDCMAIFKYKLARIRIFADYINDEDALENILIHELAHVATVSFKLYAEIFNNKLLCKSEDERKAANKLSFIVCEMLATSIEMMMHRKRPNPAIQIIKRSDTSVKHVGIRECPRLELNDKNIIITDINDQSQTEQGFKIVSDSMESNKCYKPRNISKVTNKIGEEEKLALVMFNKIKNYRNKLLTQKNTRINIAKHTIDLFDRLYTILFTESDSAKQKEKMLMLESKLVNLRNTYVQARKDGLLIVPSISKDIIADTIIKGEIAMHLHLSQIKKITTEFNKQHAGINASVLNKNLPKNKDIVSLQHDVNMLHDQINTLAKIIGNYPIQIGYWTADVFFAARNNLDFESIASRVKAEIESEIKKDTFRKFRDIADLKNTEPQTMESLCSKFNLLL